MSPGKGTLAAARVLLRLTVAVAGSPALTAQGLSLEGIVVRAAFAEASTHQDAEALVWLRRDLLARETAWPKDRDPDRAFSLHLEAGRLRIDEPVTLPTGTAVAGEVSRRGTRIAFDCRTDGSESWRIEGRRVPKDLESLLTALRVQVQGTPRTIDLPALLGNLAGAAVADDESATRLFAGAVPCGEVVVRARRAGSTLRVDGRSGGGLCVPALLTALAASREAARVVDEPIEEWRLRAFASADAERVEAVRQVQRTGAPALPVLRAMLHGDEASRVAAVDALLRLGAASELPRIARAADDAMPLAVAISATAVRELWPLAGQTTRGEARREISTHRELSRELAEVLAEVEQPRDVRPRAIAIAAVVLAGLLGLWFRERARGL